MESAAFARRTPSLELAFAISKRISRARQAIPTTISAGNEGASSH
jgi:hypothetical protein